MGWKNVLIHSIENQAHDKNFSPEIEKRANLVIKDDYIFDFLDLGEDFSERWFELELMKNIRQFLLEMGNQLAFIGNQYKLEVEKQEYFIDLLSYHRQLKCLVAYWTWSWEIYSRIW